MCRRQPPLLIAFIGCILHISVLVNIGCFDINPVVCPRTVVLSRGQLY
jgi:hypothetical protein